jgi:hypothetical protein
MDWIRLMSEMSILFPEFLVLENVCTNKNPQIAGRELFLLFSEGCKSQFF